MRTSEPEDEISMETDNELTLEELLDGVTPDNMHGEIDFGDPVGREIW